MKSIPYLSISDLSDNRGLRQDGDALIAARTARMEAEAALAAANAKADEAARRWPGLWRSLGSGVAQTAMAALSAEVARISDANESSNEKYEADCNAVAGKAWGELREQLTADIPCPLAEIPDGQIVAAYEDSARPLLEGLCELGSVYKEIKSCMARLREAENAERTLIDAVVQRCTSLRNAIRDFEASHGKLLEYAREVRAEAQDNLVKREDALLADMERLGISKERLLERLSSRGDGVKAKQEN